MVRATQIIRTIYISGNASINKIYNMNSTCISRIRNYTRKLALSGLTGYREVEVYRALSSKSRIDIFRLLLRGSKSVEEISEATNLRPMTVRHHVRALERVGLIDSYEKRGRVGKPRLYFEIVKGPRIISFPARHYAQVLDSTVTHLKSHMSPDEIKDFFKKVGRSSGLQIIKSLEESLEIKEWTLKEFKDAYVEKYMVELGAEPEVTDFNDQLAFRVHNCLVQELASKDPQIYCDIIDHAIHGGIQEGTKNRIEVQRLQCMGYGAPYCEFIARMTSK